MSKIEKGPRLYDPGKQLMTQSIMLEMYIPFDGAMAEKSCVFFLYYDRKYVIIKGKTLQLAVELFKKGYAYHVGYEHKEGKQAPSIYQRMYEYIFKHPGHVFSIVAPVFDNPYRLLKHEQECLWAHIKEKVCLNNNIEAYVPLWNKKLKLYGGWIPKTSLMNFRKFVKKSNTTALQPQ